jgi:hypothetical protein
MNPSNLNHAWSVIMAKTKKATEHLKIKKELQVNLIPVIESNIDFQERKEEVQDVISKILIQSHKRGRPSMKDEEDNRYAA